MPRVRSIRGISDTLYSSSGSPRDMCKILFVTISACLKALIQSQSDGFRRHVRSSDVLRFGGFVSSRGGNIAKSENIRALGVIDLQRFQNPNKAIGSYSSIRERLKEMPLRYLPGAEDLVKSVSMRRLRAV